MLVKQHGLAEGVYHNCIKKQHLGEKAIFSKKTWKIFGKNAHHHFDIFGLLQNHLS